MKSFEQTLDTTNFELNMAERVQAIRDSRILGLSAIAGYLEDMLQPEYPNFVRARWCRIKSIIPKPTNDPTAYNPKKKPGLKTINALTGSSRIAKKKDMAVILGTESSYEDGIWEHERWDMLPAAMFAYKGVARVGILPGGFGRLDNYQDAVAMLVGRNQFEAAMGTFFLRKIDNKYTRIPSRKTFRYGTLFVPDDIEVIDVVRADELPLSVPLA